MAVNDGHDLGSGLVNGAVDEALHIGAATLCIVDVALQIHFEDVIDRHQGWCHAARDVETVSAVGVAHADVAEAVEHALVDEDAVGDRQVFQKFLVHGCSPVHSALMPACAATRAQRTSSARMKSVPSSGVVKNGSKPSFSNFSSISGDLPTLTKAALSFFTMAVGVPAGAYSANQLVSSTPL